MKVGTLEIVDTIIAIVNLIATVVLSVSGLKITKELTNKTSKEQQALIKEQRIQQRKDDINISLKGDFEQKWLYVNRLCFNFYAIRDKFKGNTIKLETQTERWREFMDRLKNEENLVEEYNRKINFMCAVNKGYIPECVENARTELNYSLDRVSNITYEITTKVVTGEECCYHELAGEAIYLLKSMSERIELIVEELNKLYYE